MKTDEKKVKKSCIVFRGNQERIVADREALGAMKYKAQ